MRHSVTVGRYVHGHSKVHNMNACAKMICVLLFIAMTFMTDDMVVFLVLVFLTCSLALLTHIPFGRFLRSLLSLRFFILFMIVIDFLFGVSWQNIGFMVLRLLLIVLETTILTMTTSTTEMTYALSKLFRPFQLLKLPIHEFAFMISIAISYIPVILDQGFRILKAQASRGIDYYHTNLKGKCYAVKTMLIPLFRLSIKNADDLSNIMEIRLYDVKTTHTNYHKNEWRFFDSYLLMIHLAIFMLLLYEGVIR